MSRTPNRRKEDTHNRIVEVAARAIRRNGYDGVGVAEVMKEAGLTHGGFYAHFDSRDALLVEAVDRTGLLRDISEVLSREHINVTATSTQSSAHIARMRFTCEVSNLDQLGRVLTLVRDVKGVMSADRR